MITWYLIAAYLWWKSAELILINGWEQTSDLHRYDIWGLRVVAVFGPAVAFCIWLAWRWCDAPESPRNPLIRRSKK